MRMSIKRVGKWLGYALGGVVLLMMLIVAAAAVLLQTSTVQQRIAALISQQVNDSIKGRVEITVDGSFSLFGLSQISVSLLPENEADSRPLVRLSNIDASWDLYGLVRSLVGSGPLMIGIDSLAIGHAFVDLRADDNGNLSLVEAVALDKPSEPEPPSTAPSPLLHLEGLAIYDTSILLPPQFEDATRRNETAESPGHESEATRATATIDLIHGALDMQDELSATVGLSSLQTPVPGLPSVLFADVGASVFLDASSLPTVKVGLEGSLQGLPLTIDGIYDANEWVGRVGVDGSAEEWQGAGLGVEPTEALRLSAQAVGNLESADVHARVHTAQSTIDTAATLAFSPLAVNGALALADADPHVFHASAPTGAINAWATFDSAGQPQKSSVQLSVRQSTLENNPVPDFDLAANAFESSRVTFELKAKDDSKLELRGEVLNRADAVSFRVEGKAERLPEHQALPQLSAFDVRALSLAGDGTWRQPSESLTATLDLSVERFRVPAAGLTVAELSAHVRTDGPLNKPALEGHVTAGALRVAQMTAKELRVDAVTEPAGTSRVDAKAQIRLSEAAPARAASISTTLTSLSPLTASNTLASLTSKRQKLTVGVGKLQVGDRVEVSQIRLAGVGDATGQLTLRGNSLDAGLEIVGLDVAAVSELLQPLVPPMKGMVNANVAIKTKAGQVQSAHAFARATNLGTDTAHADHVGASLVVSNNQLSGTVNLARGQSRARVDAREIELVMLGKGTPSVRDFRGHTVLTVNAHTQDFPEVERLLGDIHAEGWFQSQVIVHQRDDLPLQVQSFVKISDVTIRKVEPRVPVDGANAREAAATKARDPEAEQPEPEWAIARLSAQWFAAYDGSDGTLTTTVDVSPADGSASAAHVALETVVPIDRFADVATLVPSLPVEGSLVIPKTNLDSLPTGSFVPAGLAASIAANVEFAGTVADPRLRGTIQVLDASVKSGTDGFPVSLVVETTASKTAVDADFRLTHDTLVLVSGNVHGAPARNEWRGKAIVDALPLGNVPFVRDYGITGALSGEVELDASGNTPSIVAKIDAKDVQAHGEKMSKISIAARLDSGAAEVKASIQQSHGHAELDALATSATGALADYRPTKVRLQTRSFEIRPLQIALQDSVGDLSGLLDGVVEVAFDDRSANATGELQLKDGLVLVPALGKQVHDIGFLIRAAPGKLELVRLDAKVERGVVRGKGKLAYDANGRLVADLNLVLPDDTPLPIANKGRDIAEASGRINVKATVDPRRPVALAVDVPELDVYFSDSVTDKVSDTASPTFVTIGTYLPDGHFVRYSTPDKTADKSASAAQTKVEPVVIAVKLGKEVWLHQGTSTFAGIRGNVEVELAEATRISGRLDLEEGRIDIQGRVFDIRPGSVTFQGRTPPNPDVVAEAAWPSPSGYTIIAAYRGSVTNGKVVLRSEPPLSYGEILNVLLFDDPEGAGGSDGSPGAGDVAATVASAGLSQSLTSLTDLDVQASIDSDPSGSPRPELGVRLTPRLAVEVAYVLEPSAALSQPPDKAFVSFDWRLSNAWSVEATLGDHGSAATDVTWKYRY
jgi:translocation and assembly module TamB